MATLKEMCDVIDSIPIDEAEGIVPFPLSESWYYLRCMMCNAEDNGRYYNGYNGVYVKDELCTYWRVGDYVITYLTDDLDFNADMLTEDMMDDLIIERA